MKNKYYLSTYYFSIVALCIAIGLPIVRLLTQIRLEDISSVIHAPQFIPMITNSMITTTIASLLSILLAFYLAWCINRTNMKGKKFCIICFTLPMLIPSISHGQGLVILFGDHGFLTNLLNINIHLYGYVGIILGGILYSFPAAFLLFHNTFKYEDYTVYEAAEVLGISKQKQLFAITLPNMKTLLRSIFFMVFTMIFTDYGVPLMVGGKVLTLPTYMYREVIGLLDFSKGAIIGILLLMPAIVAFFYDLKNPTKSMNTASQRTFQITTSKKANQRATIVCFFFVVLFCLPIVAFVLLSFMKQYPNVFEFSLDTYQKSMRMGLGQYAFNAIVIALWSAFIGTCTTYICAFFTTLNKNKRSCIFLHFMSIISLAIPGLVLGLSYVLTFQSSWMYGTIVIMVLVNIVHFFSSPYLLAYHGFENMDMKLDDVATTLGISKFKMMLNVYAPSMKTTIYEMFTYLFVNCMVTISAVSFLTNFHTMPIALMIPQLDSQSFIEATAFVSLMIFVINLIVKLIMNCLKKCDNEMGG